MLGCERLLSKSTSGHPNSRRLQAPARSPRGAGGWMTSCAISERRGWPTWTPTASTSRSSRTRRRPPTGAWGWHAEAGLHVLRMIATGVFDRHPGLRLIVGHCGEMVPFMLARIDAMLRQDQLELAPSGYFLRNIWVTTSGLFSLPPVLCTVQVLGVDRVLFSVDYPFGSNAAGRALLDTLPLAPADVAKIAGGNAERVLGLGAPADQGPRGPGPPADQPSVI